jgi:hypothetical protein
MGHPQFISLYRQEINIDFLLQFSSYLYTNSERNRWAEHILIPSFVIRSISSSSDTCAEQRGQVFILHSPLNSVKNERAVAQKQFCGISRQYRGIVRT